MSRVDRLCQPGVVAAAALVLAAACAGTGPTSGAPAAVNPDPKDAPAADAGLRLRLPAPGERASLVQLHMADHYADLRLMQRALVAGELTEVRDYATALALDRSDPELAAWADQLARMREAAAALAAAPDVPGACRREPALAAVCGNCHLETGAQLPLVDDGPPADNGSTPVRMARHQWAADRLWRALIVPSNRAWQDALDVLADTPLPLDELAVDVRADERARLNELARRLQTTARDGRPITDPAARASAYGELLVTCAACHALTR